MAWLSSYLLLCFCFLFVLAHIFFFVLLFLLFCLFSCPLIIFKVFFLFFKFSSVGYLAVFFFTLFLFFLFGCIFTGCSRDSKYILKLLAYAQNWYSTTSSKIYNNRISITPNPLRDLSYFVTGYILNPECDVCYV